MTFGYVLFNPNTNQYGYINVARWEGSIQGTDTPTAATLFSTEDRAKEWESSTWCVVALMAATPALGNLPAGWRWRQIEGKWEAYHAGTGTSIFLNCGVVTRSDLVPDNLQEAKIKLLGMKVRRTLQQAR